MRGVPTVISQQHTRHQHGRPPDQQELRSTVRLRSDHPLAREPSVKVLIRAPEVADAKSVFAAMPFSPEYEDVYFVAMTESAKAVGAACERLDHLEFVGRIGPRMIDEIRGADALIADLSGANPNVLYELGYRASAQHPCDPHLLHTVGRSPI